MRFPLLLLSLLCGCEWSSFVFVSENSILAEGEEVGADIVGRWCQWALKGYHS